MYAPPLTVYDTMQFVQSQDANYVNEPLAMVNDHVVRISVMTEPYFWHLHPDSDETFLVIEGVIFLDLEDRTVELSPGQLFTVPANVNHRTRPKTARSVNLTFESRKMTTVKTEGN